MKSVANTSSVEKSFVLLEYLAASGKPVSLQEVTDAVKLSKPTAYRLLQSLHALGYVTRPAGSRSYLVGPRTARLASCDPQSGVKALARPLLQRLYRELNETVNLGTLSGTQVLYLDYLETTQALRFIVTPGQSAPWFCTALGRAVAAQLSDTALDRLLAETKFQVLTPRAVANREELRRRIRKVREAGYAEEREESVQGVCCLAVSLAPLGFAAAAISVALPVQRLTPKRKASILKMFRAILRS